MQMNMPGKALEAYKADLQKHPNTFNALYGAGLAAEKLNDTQTASSYYQQLLNVVGNAKSNRAELKQARQYLKMKSV
jgi:tetratricopeptide (TPR) repeat protein